MSKKLSLYGILTAICLVFGYIEAMLPLTFIAPGIKLGLANSVALLLTTQGDFKGAIAVNTSRVLLCAILFGSPFSLIFSLSAGALSLFTTWLLYHLKSVSVIGISAAAAAVHNITQLIVAFAFFGSAVFYYLPFLLLSALVSGTAIGIISYLISKKIKTKHFL